MEVGSRLDVWFDMEVGSGSGRLQPGFMFRRKHHLHRKTSVLPSSLKMLTHFWSLQSDRQCFSHEDGCFAPLTNYLSSLPELPPTATSDRMSEPLRISISNQMSEPLPTSISVRTRCNEVSQTYEKQFTGFRHVFHNFGPINTQFLHIYFRKYDL